MTVAAAEVWGAGAFELAAHMFAPIHLDLVAGLGPQSGERWLDLGTGTGAVAVLAARRGADVTGVDFAPRMIETARRNAADKGLDVRFQLADVQQLPFPDGGFDVVCSSMGAIYASDHAAVARELARVCRAGGRLGLTAWERGAGLSPVFARYDSVPELGAEEWADEAHVRRLLGDAFELGFERRSFRYAPEPAGVLWERMTAAIGPFKAVVEELDEAERDALERDFTAYVESFDGAGVPADYVLVLGRRR